VPKQQTILLVEDDPGVRKLLRKALEIYGYLVIEAKSGPEAREAWGQHKNVIDLLLTDLVIPGGVCAYQLSKEFQAEKSELKVLFSTGHKGALADKGVDLREEFNFLEKPYDPATLVRAVRNNLGQPESSE
jgi:two-component system cell cycle sensor histidine kinase/response regulator CckA